MNLSEIPLLDTQIEIDKKQLQKNLYSILDYLRQHQKVSFIRVVPTVYIDPFHEQFIQNLVIYVPNGCFVQKERQFAKAFQMTVFKSDTPLEKRHTAAVCDELYYIADALLRAYPDHTFDLELFSTALYEFQKEVDLRNYVII